MWQVLGTQEGWTGAGRAKARAETHREDVLVIPDHGRAEGCGRLDVHSCGGVSSGGEMGAVRQTGGRGPAALKGASPCCFPFLLLHRRPPRLRPEWPPCSFHFSCYAFHRCSPAMGILNLGSSPKEHLVIQPRKCRQYPSVHQVITKGHHSPTMPAVYKKLRSLPEAPSLLDFQRS